MVYTLTLDSKRFEGLRQKVETISRLKTTSVAYLPPPEVLVKRKGRPQIYGQKVRLHNFFSSADGLAPHDETRSRPL